MPYFPLSMSVHIFQISLSDSLNSKVSFSLLVFLSISVRLFSLFLFTSFSITTFVSHVSFLCQPLLCLCVSMSIPILLFLSLSLILSLHAMHFHHFPLSVFVTISFYTSFYIPSSLFVYLFFCLFCLCLTISASFLSFLLLLSLNLSI